jgi:hypothetical protein
MKLSNKIMLIALAAVSTVGLGVGVTYAANYVAPPETASIQYGSMSSSAYNFQDLAYYFDKDSGIATYDVEADGSTAEFTLDATPTSIIAVSVDDTPAAYTLDGDKVTISAGAPTSGKAVHVSYRTRPGVAVAPFLVKNAQHLRNLAKLQNSGAFPDSQYVSVASSFQYEGVAMEPIGTSTYPFTGVFNGNNYIITGLKVVTSTLTNVGMFGVLGTNTKTGTIHSLVLAGPDISYTGSSAVNIGIIAGTRNNTVISAKQSVIESIEIYGGTSTFKGVRAKLLTGSGAVTSGVLVGLNGIHKDSGGNVGFVGELSNNPTYTSDKNYGSALAVSTQYYFWLDGSTVTSSN